MRLLTILMLTATLLAPAATFAQEDVERFTDGDATKGPRSTSGTAAAATARTAAGPHFMPHIDSLTRRDYIEFIPDGYLFT